MQFVYLMEVFVEFSRLSSISRNENGGFLGDGLVKFVERYLKENLRKLDLQGYLKFKKVFLKQTGLLIFKGEGV